MRAQAVRILVMNVLFFSSLAASATEFSECGKFQGVGTLVCQSEIAPCSIIVFSQSLDEGRIVLADDSHVIREFSGSTVAFKAMIDHPIGSGQGDGRLLANLILMPEGTEGQLDLLKSRRCK